MKLKNLLTQIATCGALTLAAAAAHADTYNFTLIGDYSASWQMDSTPVPDRSNSTFFVVEDVPGFANPSGLADVYFYSAGVFGGLMLVGNDEGTLLITNGPQMYNGSEDSPTFKLGTFEMTQYDGPGKYTLTISPVPEPATFALLLGGLGVVGAAAARRRGAERDPA